MAARWEQAKQSSSSAPRRIGSNRNWFVEFSKIDYGSGRCRRLVPNIVASVLGFSLQPAVSALATANQSHWYLARQRHRRQCLIPLIDDFRQCRLDLV